MNKYQSIPLVLAIGGHDPSGGAGLQADIEAIAANGGHALTIVTALTTQNTCTIKEIYPQPPSQIEAQCRLIFEESSIAAIKIGLLGSTSIIHILANLLDEIPQIPVILDPILTAGNDGTQFADKSLQDAICEYLLPRCTLVTPNSIEARILGKHADLACCAETIITNGCASVLITGTHETSHKVINQLYTLSGLLQEYQWPRLIDNYHGSGCTITSAIATQIALGKSLASAVIQAQLYTWESLQQAFLSGHCQLTPNRFYAQRC